MNPFRRRLLWGSTLLTAVSGLAYFYIRQFMEPVDEWAIIHHPLEPWILKAHILVAPVMLFAVGMVTWDHVWRHIRSGIPTGRRSGWAVTAAFGPLVVSGYLLQTITGPELRSVVAWLHLGLGLICSLAFASHRRVLRRRRRSRIRSGLPVLRPDSLTAHQHGTGPESARSPGRPPRTGRRVPGGRVRSDSR